jgi:ribosomal protein S18 acetylase RimI-like enzyme
MEIRPIQPDDVQQLQAFFRRLPEGDRTFFKEDVLDPDTVEAWARDRRGQRSVAVTDGAIIGYVAIFSGVGWQAHVGEIRLVVDPVHRRAGVGRDLARHALIGAVESELRKVFVEVVADQQAAVAMFQALGFEPEALLRDHVCPGGDELHDLMVLAHHIEDTWAELVTTGVAEQLG